MAGRISAGLQRNITLATEPAGIGVIRIAIGEVAEVA